jgi:hypothetical protein
MQINKKYTTQNNKNLKIDPTHMLDFALNNSWIFHLTIVGGRRSKRLGPSPTLGSLGPFHQWRHKSRVSLRGSPCAHGVGGTPHGKVRDIHSVRYHEYLRLASHPSTSSHP